LGGGSNGKIGKIERVYLGGSGSGGMGEWERLRRGVRLGLGRLPEGVKIRNKAEENRGLKPEVNFSDKKC